jgi:hypothetical protein
MAWGKRQRWCGALASDEQLEQLPGRTGGWDGITRLQRFVRPTQRVVSGPAVSAAGLTEWQVIAHEMGHNFGAIVSTISSIETWDLRPFSTMYVRIFASHYDAGTPVRRWL